MLPEGRSLVVVVFADIMLIIKKVEFEFLVYVNATNSRVHKHGQSELKKLHNVFDYLYLFLSFRLPFPVMQLATYVVLLKSLNSMKLIMS